MLLRTSLRGGARPGGMAVSGPLRAPSLSPHYPAGRLAPRSVCTSVTAVSKRTSRGGGEKERKGRADHPRQEEPMRLGKALSRAGVASRRKSEDIVFQGRVAVNGKIVTKPETKVRFGKDRIDLDGVSLLMPTDHVSSASRGSGGGSFTKFHFMINKPKGYMCSSEDSRGKSVLTLFSPWIENYVEKRQRDARRAAESGRGGRGESDEGGEESLILPPRLFTVGRLDVATTGLLLVTNDGDWAQQVAHPKFGVLKEYIVTTKEKISLDHLERIARGTEVEGSLVVPKRVEGFDYRTGDRQYERKAKVVVGEGKKHEVRELVRAAGLELLALKRTKIGGLAMGQLKIGQFRGLKKRELDLVLGAGERPAKKT